MGWTADLSFGKPERIKDSLGQENPKDFLWERDIVAEVISYDDLYELLRAEKRETDLEKLSLNDLAKIAAYFKAKEDLLKQQGESTIFSSTKGRAKVQLEIDNAMQMLRDIFEQREAKVINRAVFSIRSESKLKDTTNMLEHEEELHNALLDLLDKHRKAFFDSIETQKVQVITAEPKKEEEKPVTEPEIKETEQKQIEVENEKVE